MKKLLNIFSLALVSLFFMTACQDDDNELGRMLSKTEIDYEVVQDYAIDEGGNTVILRNLTPGTVPIWDYGTGRSNRMVDTVRFPFQGEYKIKLSALTAGGVVEVDSVTIEVTEDNLMYVNDPLWTALTGGPGESKTWIFDNGNYGLATGPLAYADPTRDQVWGNYQTNWEPAAADIGITETDLAAEMTFSLTGGPYLTTVKPNEGGDESGTFSLSADSHTLSTTDATIIRPASFIANAANWNENLNILELTENQLRIAVYRTNDEGPWWYILNYVSKEYAENYVPVPEGPVEDPNFDHGVDPDFLAVDRTTTKTWKLDTEVPFNWTNLTGGFLNEWNSRSDYPEWAGYNDAAVENINDASISFSEDGTVVVTQDDGTTAEGTYTTDVSKNLITFSGVTPLIPIAGDIAATTTAENQWKIVAVEKDVMDQVSGIWFGKRATDKDEYTVFHFILQSDGTVEMTPEEAMIKALTGNYKGSSSRTFKIDTNWPVDWTNLEGEGGWTVAGTQDEWYWNQDTEDSIMNQRLTFSLENGEIMVTKLDVEGNTSTSPVQLDVENMLVTIPDIQILQFYGTGAWLPIAGPDYKWVRGSFAKIETEGFWLGAKTPDKDEYTIYHYILE